MKETLLAAAPLPMTMLDYQPVFSFRGGHMFLKSVNILFENSMLKKIHLKKQISLEKQTDISAIIGKILADQIKTAAHNKENNKNKRPSKPAQSKEARAAAAKDLFENLNL